MSLLRTAAVAAIVHLLALAASSATAERQEGPRVAFTVDPVESHEGNSLRLANEDPTWVGQVNADGRIAC